MSPRLNRCKILLMLFIYLTSLVVIPEAYGDTELEWEKTIDGGGSEIIHASILTADNCLLLVGEQKPRNQEDTDVYIAKLSLHGELLWNKTFSEDQGCDDAAYSVEEIKNGYIITGKISSEDGIGDDVLLLKIDKNGKTLWYRHYGGNAWDWGNDVVVNDDDSYLVAGTTQSFYGFPNDIYLLKYSGNGVLLWRKRYNHDDFQYVQAVVSTADNHYLITGSTNDNTQIDRDIFLQKIDSTGKEIWYKQYGGTGKETASQIIRDGDDFFIVGKTDSYGAGQYDIYVIKVDSVGEVIWETTIGSPYDDSGENIRICSDSILITGNTFKENSQNRNMYFIKIDSYGNCYFNQTYGINTYELAINTIPIGPETYIVTGYGGESNNYDILLRKLSFKKYLMDVQTQFSVSYGSGEYYNGSTPTIGVQEEIVQEAPDTRYVFTGWNSSLSDGYNGTKNPVQILVKEDIIQTANWQKQYYVEVNCPLGCNTSFGSGWYTEGEEITINLALDEGYTFAEWLGYGLGAYNGTFKTAQINVSGPITQNIVLDKIPVYSLQINSPYGGPVGSGEYFEGELAVFNITKNIVYLDDNTRYVFDGWESSSEGGITGSNQTYEILMTGNILENAIWRKQYYVNISSTSDAVNITESDWYDEDRELLLECFTHEGANFICWDGEGYGSYDGYELTSTISITSPIKEVVIVSDSEKHALIIESIYGNFSDSSIHYNGELVSVSISPDVIYLSNNTRVVFQKWECEGEGYTGVDNPASFTISGDTIQRAIWVKQYYIESSDSLCNQWVEEGSIFDLHKVKPGLILAESFDYTVASIDTEADAVIVDNPLYLEVASHNLYLNSSFLVGFAVIASLVYASQSKLLRASPDKIKNAVFSLFNKLK